MPHNLTLKVLPGRFAVCRLEPDAQIPARVLEEPFFSIMRTADELSFVIPEQHINPDWQVEVGWRILQVLGPLDFTLVGVLAQLTEPLAKAHISIFANSTFDTDYLMVKSALLGQAVATLRASRIEVFWSE
jgi:hypothetical protein